jgi:hypothetical protein
MRARIAILVWDAVEALHEQGIAIAHLHNA